MNRDLKTFTSNSFYPEPWMEGLTKWHRRKKPKRYKLTSTPYAPSQSLSISIDCLDAIKNGNIDQAISMLSQPVRAQEIRAVQNARKKYKLRVKTSNRMFKRNPENPVCSL